MRTTAYTWPSTASAERGLNSSTIHKVVFNIASALGMGHKSPTRIPHPYTRHVSSTNVKIALPSRCTHITTSICPFDHASTTTELLFMRTCHRVQTAYNGPLAVKSHWCQMESTMYRWKHHFRILTIRCTGTISWTIYLCGYQPSIGNNSNMYYI